MAGTTLAFSPHLVPQRQGLQVDSELKTDAVQFAGAREVVLFKVQLQFGVVDRTGSYKVSFAIAPRKSVGFRQLLTNDDVLKTEHVEC